MCGRFSLHTERVDLARELGIPEDAVPGALAPRWNIAPSQPVPILRHDGGIRMALYRWGLIPEWALDPRIGNRLINARRETLATKPSFRDSFRARRCLVIADGFYEWAGPGPGGRGKVPHYVRLRSRRPFTMAGLWSRWRSPANEEVLTCTIVTGPPNDLVRDVHDRMPVILPPEKRATWLDPRERDEGKLLALLEPLPSAEMEMYAVSRRVNSPDHDDALCIEPAAHPEAVLEERPPAPRRGKRADGRQGDLFGGGDGADG